ncbi:hypothetical protein MKZ38_006580 [Zalerion maritima]|uniref:Modin n=1 Tax=Zalerion maritima TaxID=339359 RepID=A0AAD5RJU9_9PEZI|nr:hypothetical protein MKZ38_006580 [Zalerion maritima]
MADNEVILAGIALVISSFAFLTSLLQVFQQYYASASGYASCKAKVIGPWARGTHRNFKWKELRFEVRFMTPVIFLAPPSASGGPIPDEPLWEIRGDKESWEQTMTPINNQLGGEWAPRLNSKELVHTADNEKSTWLDLLNALQTRELKSKDWSAEVANDEKVSLGGEGDRTLVVFVQKKNRSWDTMPANVKKPYATTTICHLIEMTAFLGLYWKEVNRSTHRYRAEGNGYILTGEHLADLGIMFTFQKTGVAVFKESSIIPVDEIKDMCFGYVPTIFRDKAQKGANLIAVNEEPDTLEFLQLGSIDEVMQTMAIMGCNNNTVKHFKQEGSRVAHLFPVAFEVLGMLGRVMHIRRNPWRNLPNPTVWHWQRKPFQMSKMLAAFEKCIDDTNNKEFSSPHIGRIRTTSKRIVEMLKGTQKQGPFGIPLLDALHDAIDEHDQILGRAEQGDVMKVVSHVVRYHLQAVLDLVNKNDEYKKLDSAQPEEKEQLFMGLYFSAVREKVLEASTDQHMAKYASRVDTLLWGGYSGGSNPTPTPKHTRTKTNNTSSTLAPPVVSSHHLRSNSSTMLASMASDDVVTLDSDNTERIINDIWCTLVFRMLCWLTLHDFHKKDVQLPKSELIGSRLPVYIA